jgi:ketosteroid isomerase-like protein
MLGKQNCELVQLDCLERANEPESGFSPIAFAKLSERTEGAFVPTQWSRALADSEQFRAKLQQLNRNFIRSVEEADVVRFDASLALDFFNTNSDGSFIDRKAFLAQIARGSSVKNIRKHEVLIRILGDFAIIHASTSCQKPDGTEGAGRYTDDWQLRGGRWPCVSAHVTRL